MNTDEHWSGARAVSLPPWRRQEIVQIAMQEFANMEQSEDAKKYITRTGIRVKGYSAFTPENLNHIRTEISSSFWKEGLLFQKPDSETGKLCRMIIYNDTYNEAIQLYIILHEYGHAVLKHTEQCVIAEQEALCFSITMIVLLGLDKVLSLRTKLHTILAVQTGGVMKNVSA